ncbi:hypothetical protein ACFLT9_08030 [Acidobacteriota bacterium]
MKNRKFWMIFVLILVFIVGMIAGVLLDENVLDKMEKKRSRRSGTQRTPAPYYSLDLMAKELSLTESQKEKIHELFQQNNERLNVYRREINDRFRKMRDQLIDEIKNVLDNGQKLKFEAMIEKYNTEMKKRYEERRKRSQDDKKKQDAKKKGEKR